MKKLLLLLISLTLCGCWNYKELNYLSIVSGIAIEKSNDEYILGIQIINTQEKNNNFITLKTKGKTVHEALNNISLISSKKVYIGHNKLFIIDEKIAKEGIEQIIDFLMREPESHKQFQVLIAKNKTLNILENIPAKDILLLLEVASKQKGNITKVTYDELLSNIHKVGIEPVIPVIELNDTNKITLIGMSVFKGDKLLGYLNYNESLGFNLIRNNVKKDVISFKCDSNNYGSFEIVTLNTSFSIKIVNDNPFVNIDTIGSLYLSEINCDLDISKNSERKKLMGIINQQMKEIIKNTIETVKNEYNTDIFGFGYYLYQNNYQYWKNNHSNWNNLFKNIAYKINVDLNISKKGSILEPAKEG